MLIEVGRIGTEICNSKLTFGLVLYMQLVFSASFTFILPSGFILCLSAIPEYKLKRTLRSLPSKRFLCGLGAKNEEQESKTARKMTRAKERGRGEEERKETFPSPSTFFHFLVLVSFLARSKPKVPFCSETKRKRFC